MDRAVIGWVGDNFYFVWLTGWFQQQVLASNLHALSVPTLNYPEGWNLAYNEVTPAMTLLYFPISVLAGPTFSYNFALLLSFVLSGLGVFLWVRKLTSSVSAGILAGAVFAFVPFRMSHLLGHLNLMGTHWFPFYWMGLHTVLEQRCFSWSRVGATAVLVGLIGLTSQYYLYMALLLSVVYVAAYLLWIDREQALRWRGFWKRLVALGLTSLPFVLFALAPYLLLASHGDLPHRTFEEVRTGSASLTDFLLPSPRHFLWGEWVNQHFPRFVWPESTLYVGAVALPLALVAVAKRRQMPVHPGIVSLFAVMGGVACVLALGTDLHWLAKPVIVDVPGFLQTLYPYPRTFIPLPGYFLFKFLPFYGLMRAWVRFGIFVNLYISLLAGIRAAWLLHRFTPGRRMLIAVSLLILILVDFFPWNPWLVAVQGRPVDYWLAQQTAPGAVVQFPFQEVTAPEQTYYTLVHQKPFVGGFFAAFSPPQFQRIQPILNDFPTEEGVALLRDLGVHWVIVNASKYPDFPELKTTLRKLGLQLAVALDEEYVFTVSLPSNQGATANILGVSTMADKLPLDRGMGRESSEDARMICFDHTQRTSPCEHNTVDSRN